MTDTLSFAANIEPAGVVRFRAVPPGRYHVYIQCADHILREGPRVLEVAARPLPDLEWIVAPGATLTVLTVDERDRVLPNAGFFVVYPKWGKSRGSFATPAVSDDEGRFLFADALYPGIYEIKPGMPFDADAIRVPIREGDEGPITVKVRFHGSASIEATLQTKNGVPIDGLTVTAVPISAAPARNAEPPATTPVFRPNIFSAIPLGAGKYRIRPVESGNYEIHVDDRVNETVRKTVSVSSGEMLSTKIEINRDGQIRGLVLDENGVPVPDAWVAASVTNSRRDPIPPADPFGSSARVMTDSDGAFVLERLAENDSVYRIRVEEAGGASGASEGVKVGDRNVTVVIHPATSVDRL